MAKVRILVVEDDSIIAMDLIHSLQNLQYTVIGPVDSGEVAVVRAEDHQPDLVLMDIMLKGEMDGIAAAKEIRRRFRIPVVYLTAFATEATLRRAMITEPFGYILKPFRERELHTTIEMALYRHKLESEIKKSKEWMTTVLRSIGDGVIATDAQGQITFMNPVAEALTGWQQEEALGQDHEELFKILDAETLHPNPSPINKVLQEEKTVQLTTNNLLLDKNGMALDISHSAAPIWDESGKISGVVLVFRDYREYRKLEAERTQTSKLASLSILAGGIAHDFNNLLTAIMGNIAIAALHAEVQNLVIERLSQAEKACLRAQGLIQQLRTYSVGGIPQKKTVSIAEILNEATSFVLKSSNVRREAHIPAELWEVAADKGQISQVINNMLFNADEAMPQGGIVKVCAENILVDADSSLNLAEGRYVRIAIKDRGTGIPKDHLDKIFDPYFTTKKGGNGLGLAMAYSIIKSYEGCITVESEPGSGTTFFIYLPASSEKKLTHAKEKESLLIGRGKILLMDDEEMILETSGAMLQRLGYEVEFAKDGHEAVELYKVAQSSGKPFNAVILDLTIPGSMGGKETILRLKAIDPNVKSIVSSGYAHDSAMSDCEKYGFQGVLPKPYRMRELGEAMHDLLTKD